MQYGRTLLSEVRDITEIKDDSSERTVVNKKPNIDWDSIRLFIRKQLYRSCYSSGGVNSSSDKFSSAGSERCSLLKGIDGVARSSQYVDRFDNRIKLGVSNITIDVNFGK